MNYIDMFILVLLAWAVFKGYTRGFILQMTVLAALGLGIFAALKLSDFTAEQLEGHISVSSETLNLIAMGVTFLLVFIGVNLIGRMVEKMVEAIELSFINRLFGIVFSVSKLVIICGVLLAFIDRVDQKTPILPDHSREKSLFFQPLTSIATAIFPSLKVPGGDYDDIKVEV